MTQENHKELLEAIWEHQSESPLYFHSDHDGQNLKREKLNPEALPTKQRGLYWLWTDYTDDQLEKLTRGNPDNKSEIDIPQLVQQRKCLANICKIGHSKKSNFRLVYNGKGGYNGNSKGFGLRERILQEFNANSVGTGTLNLLNKDWDDENKTKKEELKKQHIKHWAVTFFNFDGKKEREILEKVIGKENVNNGFYNTFAPSLEINWRVHYGAPILSRL